VALIDSLKVSGRELVNRIRVWDGWERGLERRVSIGDLVSDRVSVPFLRSFGCSLSNVPAGSVGRSVQLGFQIGFSSD